MKLKHLVLSTAALACSLSLTAQAQSFANCAATPLAEFDGSIVEAAIATPELSTLVDAIVAADLVDTINSLDDVTVYAPTNDAFGAIPGPILTELLADTGTLTAVLVHHVSSGNNDPRKFFTPVAVESLLGQDLTFDRKNGAPHVDNATVACQGVNTNQGAVYILDSVLVPALKSASAQ